jgi:hypothetical protein
MSSKRNPRRESGGLRSDHLDSGAFLIQFKEPTEPVDMFHRPVHPSIKPPGLLAGKDWQSAVDKYRTMERKGFRVTKDIGCLIPHEQYSTYQQGATVKGHRRTFAFFGRWLPSNVVLRNEYGWPMQPQVSHLCHRRSCARPDHLIAEEQWRNIKRNYCGHDGVCDCGNTIKCLRRYQMDDQADEPEFCTTKAEVEEVLKGAPSHVIHGEDAYQDRDAKSAQRKANKLKRARSQALHKYATERKQSRLGTVREEEPGSDGEDSEDDAFE